MSYHYKDIDNLPPMKVPDNTGVLLERNALYIILRDFLSDDEIHQRINEVYAGKYAMRNTNEKGSL